MSYTPLVRWRNFTLENLKTLLELYPDMIEKAPRAAVAEEIEERFNGYKRTAYQFGCQLGIESRSEFFSKQNYLCFLDDEGLKKYLGFWFKMYVCPNPYVNSEEEPVCPFALIAGRVLESPERRISFSEFCSEIFGDGKSMDIFRNALAAWGKPLRISEDTIYVEPEDDNELARLFEKVNGSLPMQNNKDVEEFFARFSCRKFMEFYELASMENYADRKGAAVPYGSGPFDYGSTAGTAVNKIFYGTPGCGKSYYIEHSILGKDRYSKNYIGEYDHENIIRVTFYQDYSNAEFVGQIMPKIIKGENGSSTVKYAFNPGPFTLALIRALSSPQKKVALIIEELNRGNAPAVFGDILQLLDRDENGISEYGVVNPNLTDYLNEYKFDVNGEQKRYSFSEIRLPGNLYIFATMNASDQNVYTLDTAFIRRWEKKKVKNSFAECSFANLPVPGMEEYSWQNFVKAINGWIALHLEELQINEDKQIGAFFVKEKLLRSGSADNFAYKVFDYLWNDVAKLDREIFFNRYNTLEELIAAYRATGAGVFRPGIFAEPESIREAGKDNE